LEPFRIVDHGGGISCVVDVVDEAEFLDREVEERTPLPEVAVISGEDDRNVAADVEQHEGGGWGRSRVVAHDEGIGRGGAVRTVHGQEQRKVEVGSERSV